MDDAQEAARLAQREKTIPGRRIVAAFLDFAILIVVDLIIAIPSFIVLINTFFDTLFAVIFSNYLIAASTGAICLAVDALYLVAYPRFRGGQTLGLRFFDLKLSDKDGNPLESRQYLIRAIVTLSLIFLTLGLSMIVEVICICLSPSHRDFTDVVSGAYIKDVDPNAQNG